MPFKNPVNIYSLQAHFFFDIKVMVLFCGLERIPTFLIPINPPFADISPL
jgi:hypothetical protein